MLPFSRHACKFFVYFLVAATAGDPHITTLDGVSYTFNGVGEYYLLDTEDNILQVQGRAEPIVLSNHPIIPLFQLNLNLTTP